MTPLWQLEFTPHDITYYAEYLPRSAPPSDTFLRIELHQDANGAQCWRYDLVWPWGEVGIGVEAIAHADLQFIAEAIQVEQGMEPTDG